MLPRSQRLSTEQLDSVMEKGRVTHSSLFLVRVLGGQKDIRIAAIASKKIAKTAVARNLIRRKTYNAVKTIKSKINPGLHIALFAKSVINTKKVTEIETDVQNLFVKAGLLR